MQYVRNSLFIAFFDVQPKKTYWVLSSWKRNFEIQRISLNRIALSLWFIWHSAQRMHIIENICRSEAEKDIAGFIDKKIIFMDNT